MKRTVDKYTRNGLIFGLAGLVMSSCGGSVWTSDQEATFLNECKAEGGSGSYCRCFMEKVMTQYPNYEDSKHMDFESAVEMAKSCE